MLLFPLNLHSFVRVNMANPFIFNWVWLLQLGVCGVDTDRETVSVVEGNTVTLHTGVKTNQQEKIKWFFNDIRIAQISDYLSKTCTDVQCNEGTERFRDRLKLDPQTGSLTITNTTTTDSGLYRLQMISSRNISEIIFSITFHAKINGDPSRICTDGQCEDAGERFRNRLKLDHQNGSLTITNTRNTDSGLYHLEIITNSSSIRQNYIISILSQKSFSVPFHNYLMYFFAGGVCVGVLLFFAGENLWLFVFCIRGVILFSNDKIPCISEFNIVILF
ncbi:uncharacterized protein LOC122327429 isoform X3 [Puntigrus tetrazona]|uniref:uncharacterized protein LOC122327429 isoform X3 n=1 Tax=Puntigrus tetrazona TaxID=1606681 RepID=UPI001C8AFA0D|nr:uncharacterized protein LOC122327429 isoform X3 [Puntigrus tetrazona]